MIKVAIRLFSKRAKNTSSLKEVPFHSSQQVSQKTKQKKQITTKINSENNKNQSRESEEQLSHKGSRISDIFVASSFVSAGMYGMWLINHEPKWQALYGITLLSSIGTLAESLASLKEDGKSVNSKLADKPSGASHLFIHQTFAFGILVAISKLSQFPIYNWPVTLLTM